MTKANFKLNYVTLRHKQKKETKMDLKLLFDIKVNENLLDNWLKFKNEVTLKYTYYYESNRDETIGVFKFVNELLAGQMVNEQHNPETLSAIRTIKQDIKKHIEYLMNFKEI